MEKQPTQSSLPTCVTCNKIYSSMSSLCHHNQKYHPKDNNKIMLGNVSKCSSKMLGCVSECSSKMLVVNNNENLLEINKSLTCESCNKVFKHRSSKSKHKQTCTPKIDEIEKLQEEQKTHKEEQKKFIEQQKAFKEEQKLIKLKLRLEKMDRLDSPTFNKVNKLLKERSYKNNMMMNSMNTINTNSNNGYSVVNNYNNPIFQLGTENITSILSTAEKKLILEQKDFSLDKLVEIVHCGANYHQFKNVVITNIKDEYAYTYNADAGFFVKSKMNDTINDLISYRMKDIEAFYKELKDMDRVLGRGFQQLIKSFLEQMNEIRPDDEYENPDTSEKYKHIKDYKLETLKIFIYNNQDKITKDILMLIQ
jgi:hypothetical protein